jgi:transposase-like protein
MKCPYCNTDKFVIKNGFTPKRKQKYICQNIKEHLLEGFVE